MTSHTPQPPAGDDLVARLRGKGRTFGRPTELELEAASRIEALTQHTEPMAGEVEVVAWLGRRGATKTDPLVRKSSYGALAAAKDAEIERLRIALAKAYDAMPSILDLKDEGSAT